MADEEGENPSDPEIERLVAVLKKDEDERHDEDWDLLGSADPEKLKKAAEAAGVSID